MLTEHGPLTFVEIQVTAGRIAREYARLDGLFRAKFVSFERKRYANLSHTPNKAMNLNSYIGLLGQRCREVMRLDGLYVEPASDGSLHFPDPEFIVSVDADSLITSDYALQLVRGIRRPRQRACGHCTVPVHRRLQVRRVC